MREYKAQGPDITLKLTTLTGEEVVLKPVRSLSAQECVNIGREWQSLEENNNLAINTNKRLKRQKSNMDELDKRINDVKVLVSKTPDNTELQEVLSNLITKKEKIETAEFIKTKTGIEINATELATLYDKTMEWFIENLDSVTITTIISDIVKIVTGVQKN